MTAAERLQEKAEEYRALATEHNNATLWIVETVLRELAEALEQAGDEVAA